MELRLTAGERRLATGLTLLVGLVHVALPELLVDLVRLGYDAVLDVSFVSRDRTAGRVRLLGLGCLVLAVALRSVPVEEGGTGPMD